MILDCSVSIASPFQKFIRAIPPDNAVALISIQLTQTRDF